MGGIMPLIAGLCRGVQLEIVTRDASVIWERLRTGKVTALRSAPGIWANLMNYYKETISNLTPHVIEQYIRGVQNLHSAITSGGYLLPHVRRFWVDEMNLPMSMTYAGTEMGGPAIYRSSLHFPDEERRVGTPWPDVAVKLSGGDQGEILIKSPTLFLGYLDNSEATKAAFDEDGYFKTGDIGRWQDEEYILMGRTSDPNNHLTEQRVGILVRVKVSNEGRGESLCHQHDLTLERLREDLSHDLPLSMLPTIMHVLRDGEEIPKTLSDKVRRKDAVSKFFPVSGLELSPMVGKWDAEAFVV
ncbi:Acyl-CoA synthetase family member 3, mitochondrial [Penicillium subrubescens]|uniref:Acyl-CoA synthetase family member 3, mitochondrial n=1 Tax=Penicillium subrubescens TaxID=1316194 RepID=A0A1Q5UP71_9EURO|nr:Acyl-CoA synthetase family member 3, mitochondrial [Penicillium subrubescens]